MAQVPTNLPPVTANRTIRLSDMMDAIIQKSYHDLVILAEVDLPRKSDLDRKIAIMQFLSKTYNYLVRFLALLKWSSNMPKVEKCFQIVGFLEEQSMLFVETADVLARMARETLANSKLPCYQVAFAIDVLNSKTCPRLPTCIMEKTVKEEPLSTEETDETLRELEHALLYRLLTFDRPPPEMRHFVIRRGRVTFRVEHEFEVSLTVMGEDRTMPYRVLDLKILVAHSRVGEGRALLHPRQVNCMIQLLQSRILDHAKPLDHVYEFLHFFAQSLQIEVIQNQLTKHLANAGMDYYRVEKFERQVAKEGQAEPATVYELTVSYWEEYGRKDPSKNLKKDSDKQLKKSPFTITIAAGISPKLQVTHKPTLKTEIPFVGLDVGALMMSVIHVRVKQRLDKLQADFSRSFACSSGGLPALLIIPLYARAPRSQCVHISIDYYSGMHTVYLKQLPTSKHLVALKEYINSGWNISSEKVLEHLRFIRLELTLDLVRQYSSRINLQEFPVERLDYTVSSRFQEIGPFKAAFRYQKKPEFHSLLIVSCYNDPQTDEAQLDFNVALLEHYSHTTPKVVALINRRSFFDDNLVHETQISPKEQPVKDPMEMLKGRLHAMSAQRGVASDLKVTSRVCPPCLATFAQTVVSGLSQLVVTDLRVALKNRGFSSESVHVDEHDGCLTLPVILPDELVRSCIFRRLDKLAYNPSSLVQCDLVFGDMAHWKGTGKVTLSYDASLESAKTADLFAYDYGMLLMFVRMLRKCKSEDQVEFDGKSLVIHYGPRSEFSVSLSWDRNQRRKILDLYAKSGWNPHRQLRSKLLTLLEKEDLVTVCRILQQTAPLMVAVRQSTRAVSVVSRIPRSLTPQVIFQFVPLSLSNFVVVFKGVYALFVRVLPGSKYMITDVGNSEVAKSTESGKVFSPIAGLKRCMESVLGSSLVVGTDTKSDGFAPSDAELENALGRFFTPLRSCSVQLVEGGSVL